jgi:peptide/nickel transport system substrate-binding protein
MRRSLFVAAVLAGAAIAVAPAATAPEQTPKRGGTLVIGTVTQAEPACLNVLVLTCNFPWLVEEILSGAFEAWPDATLRPDLVSGARVVRRQPVTIVYRIRPEARWSDGVPVTARDFVFTHQMRLDHPRSIGGAVIEDHLKVRRVRAVGPKTVEVVLRAPWVDWRLLFDLVLPRHAVAGQEFESLWKDGIENPRTRRAIGSGPFLFAGWERGKQLTLVRNPHYWGPRTAYLDRVEFRFFDAEDTADLLRRGEIDMIDPHWQSLVAQALELHRQRAPGIRFDTVLGPQWEHFAIRQGPGGHPALRKRLVRQAIAYGIDRARIAREAAALTLASAAASKPLDSVVFMANSSYHERNWSRYRHRPARARQLLEQAGCRLGADGIYVCDGRRLSLRFAATAGIERRELTVRLAQAQLREVGIEVVPDFGPSSAVVTGADSLLRQGNFDVLLFAWVLGVATEGPADFFGCQRPQNYYGYCDRLVTRDLVNATRTLDRTRRVKLLNRVDVRLARAVPAIPLFQYTYLTARRTAVRGVVQNGFGSGFWDLENWWLAEPR